MILDRLQNVTLAPVTSTARGLRTEVPLGPSAGLDHESVASCDTVTTVPQDLLVRRRGELTTVELFTLSAAVRVALDLN